MPNSAEYVSRAECGIVSNTIKESIDRLGKRIEGQARDTNEALRTIVSEQREIKTKLDKHIGFHQGAERSQEMSVARGGMWAKWGATIMAIGAALVAAGLFIGSLAMGGV